MTLKNTDWEIVAYVQLIFFAIILITLVVMVVLKYSNMLDRKIITRFTAFFGVFGACKVAGAICGIILLHQSKLSTDLTIATYIFDNVSMGVLIRCVMPFVELMVTEPEPEKLKDNPFKYDNESKVLGHGVGTLVNMNPRNMPFKLLTLLIVAAIICTVVGTTNIDSSSSGPNSPMRAGSILSLLSIIFMALLIIWRIRVSDEHKLTGKILLGSILFFIVRVSYSIVSSFAGVNFDKPSKYLLIFGEYQYYTFMALMQECIISIILLINFYFFHSNDYA